jgi:toxin FitB
MDTSIVSELMRDLPNRAIISWLDRQARQSVWMTAITVMELYHGIETLPPGRRESLREALGRLSAEKLDDRIANFNQGKMHSVE